MITYVNAHKMHTKPLSLTMFMLSTDHRHEGVLWRI